MVFLSLSSSPKSGSATSARILSQIISRLSSIPNVIPPERLKTADFPGFYEAVMTKMEDPFEQLLDGLNPPVNAIIGDVELRWPIGVGNRRNIPVAASWTMSASFFLMLHHLNLLVQNRHLSVDFSDVGDGHIGQIPGISSSQLIVLQTVIHVNDRRVLQLALQCISKVPKAQYLLLPTVQEVEVEAIKSLEAIFSFPIFTIGPAIAYLELEQSYSTTANSSLDYLNWLDSQPAKSVLYISFGGFVSVSGAQMDEIAAALKITGICFIWVARGEASRLKEKCSDGGLVVPWCDQLKVLSHSSIGGFWSHCGWNSTQEAVFAGVPMLTFPLFLDQVPNSRQIVEEWKNGWELKRSEVGSEVFLAKEEIAEVLKGFMDLESRKEVRERAEELKDICHLAIAKGGSSDLNLEAFIRSISSVGQE
ncbi:UDP-glycosyltransferase [Quillaja saponaria]|uniref:UDP-glycosyltransferase n=1 Tax=Quillaja saponaria TaxID=32244 RepID=A0AAD7LL49_QUISA|nr:UDP-glycosyltransferase [Quillaja saponaria]